MNMLRRRLPSTVPILIAVTIAVGAMLAAALLFSGSHTQAASVTPELLEGASNEGKTCADLEGEGQTWIEFKLEDESLSNGSHSDGTLTVTISNLADGGSSFDWTSNIGVDGVVVKDGVDGAHFYRYDPPAESTGDDDLVTPGEEKAISHISFCYDLPDETPTPTPTATPEATPEATPGATPSPTGQPLGEQAGPTPTPEALPETGGAPASGGSSDLALLLAIGGLALLAGAGTFAVAAARRRR